MAHPSPISTAAATISGADPATRRDALGQLGLAMGAALLGTTPACARASEAADDDALLTRLLEQRAPVIAARDRPYRITRSLKVRAGTTVTIEEGARLLWAGSVGSLTELIGVFVADGDEVAIVAKGAGAVVECATASPFVYAALMRGHRGFTVIALHARECQHVHANAATDDYAAVRLDGADANTAREVHVSGGGARYAAPQPAGHGACFLHFARGCSVRDARYHNVPNGVQWWGGNADPARPPATGGAHNERKCRDIVIERVVTEHVAGAGIWGAMGQDIIVRDCQVAEIGDVGFDAEGCNRVLFERCTARNARNGCFSTFFLCNGVRFVDCVGIVDEKAFPLVRVYNESQTNNDNLGLEIIGGRFECRDASGPSTIDTAMGPVGTFLLSGATLRNVRVDLAHSNMHRSTVTRNRIELTVPLGNHAAIEAGSSKSLRGAPTVVPGSVIITENDITYRSLAAGAAVAIRLREDDFNSSASDIVRGNRITGAFSTAIVVINASANLAIVPQVAIEANRYALLAPGARLLRVTTEGASAARPSIRWDAAQARDGRRVPLDAALR